MSFSLYKKFQACEAEAMAELRGEWTPKRDLTPLLVGNYLHSYFEGPKAHQRFIDEHPEIISTRGASKGKLKKDFVVAEEMINALDGDPEFRRLYKGRKEMIVKGELNGVKWMGKLDCLRPDHGMILDLKTAMDLHKKFWLTDDSRWGNFIEARGYITQMAIYQELTNQRFGIRPNVVIVGVTKQSPPDKAAIPIDQYAMNYALDDVITRQERIQALRDGTEEPTRCEQCDYCRSTKHLEVVSLDSLID